MAPRTVLNWDPVNIRKIKQSKLQISDIFYQCRDQFSAFMHLCAVQYSAVTRTNSRCDCDYNLTLQFHGRLTNQGAVIKRILYFTVQFTYTVLRYSRVCIALYCLTYCNAQLSELGEYYQFLGNIWTTKLCYCFVIHFKVTLCQGY